MGSTDMWLGGSDNAYEGQWLWANGSPMTYTNWYSGEPNNHGGNEECLHMRDGKWNDIKCSRKLDFICSAPVPNNSNC